MKMFEYLTNGAQDSYPLNPPHFGFLDLDQQKYADPRIHIQGPKYQPKTTKIKFAFQPKI